jgi:hypothetical protein
MEDNMNFEKEFSIGQFNYNPNSRTFFATTRELGSITESDIYIQGKNLRKKFLVIGVDESYDHIVGECMCFHFRSECGQFFAQINFV